MSNEKFSAEISVPPNETATIETHEKWEVIALPEKQCKEPPKYSPENLNNLLDRTRKEYEDYISEIITTLSLINKEIEIDIRLKSNVLKDELSLLKNSGTENIKNLVSIRTEIFSFEEIKFCNSKILCENLLEKGKELIDLFHESLKDLEKYRSDKFKEILKDYYEKMETCSYKLPYEIQLFFEEQILHINQMLLTNLRNNKELHLDLIVIFTNNVKLLMYNITNYEEEWKDICKAEITKRLREYITDEEINEFFNKHRDRTMTEIILLFYEYEAYLLELLRCDPKETAWYNEIKNVIGDLEKCAKQLVISYEDANNEFHINSSPALIITDNSLLTLKMNELMYEEYEGELEDYIAELENEGEHEEKEIFTNEKLEMLWKISLKELLQFLHMKYLLLKDLKDLWEKHIIRIENLKIVILKDLDMLILKNDKSLQGKQEMALNIAIDSLRQELNEKKMIKSMKKVTKTLNKIGQTMTSHKEAEIKLISKYVEYIGNNTEIFITAVKQFLNKYGEEGDVPTLRKELRIKNLKLFVELQQCIEPIEEINSWKFKIIEQIIEKTALYPEKQEKEATSWIAEHIEKVAKKFKNKTFFHQMRYERIQLEIYDVRLAEIKKHEEKFESHKEGAEQYMTDIQQQITEFEKKQEADIKDFNNKLEEMAEESKNCKTSFTAQICMDEATKLVQKTSNDFRETVKNYVEYVLNKINEILTSNYNFLEHITLFHEGGNFHPKEAAALSKKLLQFETVIQKRSTLLKNAISGTEKRLKKSIDATATVCYEKTNTVHLTLKFKEESEFTIVKLQTDLKNEVYQMKYKRKKIDTINEKIKRLTNTNDFSNAYFVIKYCKELINLYCDYKEYLEETDHPSRIYDILNVPINVSPSPIATPKSKSSKKSGTTASKKSKKDKEKAPAFTSFNLFEFFNDEKVIKFMPDICHILQEEYLKTQNLAKEFYSNLFKIEKVELPETYNEFISGILQKCKYYYLQCLQAWAEEIQDFTIATNDLLQFATQYCSDYLQWLHEKQLSIFKDKQKQFLNNVENVKSLNIADIKNVQNQLKPLYGYPGNKQLLADLNKKMNDVMLVSKNNFYISVEPFGEQLKECLEEYKNIMAEAYELVDDFKAVLYDDMFCKKLIFQAKSVINSTNVEDFQIELDNIITFSEEDLKTNSEEDLSNLIENIEDELRLQIVEEEARQIKEEMSKTLIHFTEKLASLLRTWVMDVNTVKDLYTVKYE